MKYFMVLLICLSSLVYSQPSEELKQAKLLVFTPSGARELNFTFRQMIQEVKNQGFKITWSSNDEGDGIMIMKPSRGKLTRITCTFSIRRDRVGGGQALIYLIVFETNGCKENLPNQVFWFILNEFAPKIQRTIEAENQARNNMEVKRWLDLMESNCNN
jgi:hypothetical protein